MQPRGGRVEKGTDLLSSPLGGLIATLSAVSTDEIVSTRRRTRRRRALKGLKQRGYGEACLVATRPVSRVRHARLERRWGGRGRCGCCLHALGRPGRFRARLADRDLRLGGGRMGANGRPGGARAAGV